VVSDAAKRVVDSANYCRLLLPPRHLTTAPATATFQFAFDQHTAVASLPALGPWAPPAERGPSLESIYRVSLTVDLCEVS